MYLLSSGWKEAPRGVPRILKSVCLAGMLALAPLAANAAELAVNVPLVPSPLPTADGNLLVYELNVRNLDTSDCARLRGVLARGGSGASAVSQIYQGFAIPANTLAYTPGMTAVPVPKTPPGVPPPVDAPPGGGIVIFFFLKLPQGQPPPQRLVHTLWFSPCDGSNDTQTVRYRMPVSNAAPVVVGFPFRGTGWVAGDSVNATGTHRRTLIPVRDANGNPIAGEFHVPERYAIDWIKVDKQGRREVGPINRNASYLAFGQQIVAVADGVISRTRDGMPEQTPPNGPPNPTVEMAAGNYIMEDIGGGHYAFYAHLQPGSLLVSDGQHVVRGQVIALLGNTGNSTEPHLHFHVANANDPLMSEGVPYVFDSFSDTGVANGMNETSGRFDDVVRHAGVTREDEMPTDFSVVTVGAGGAPSASPPVRH